MNNKTVYVDEDSQIPLFGIDFIGLIDRGTNVIEIKPITLCNLECKYCFVSAGDYNTNFIVDPQYILQKMEQVVAVKGAYAIEAHIAPYGEALLYKHLISLLEGLWKIEGVKTISMQSNGLLLTPKIINDLENAQLTRINISLNTLDQKKATYLSGCRSFDLAGLMASIKLLLESSVNVLLAPVWFPGENDEDIEEIIQYVSDLRQKGYDENKLQLGIQKYLIYKTGRKLKKIRPKTWGYFYQQLNKLESVYGIKLKLGPNDFGIHSRPTAANLTIQKDDLIPLTIISKGRWDYECIGKINEDVGIKILLQKPLNFRTDMIGSQVTAKIIKANYKDNIFTAIFPYA